MGLYYLCPEMLKRILSWFMACLFLGSSIILPLGDFSLMRDIPQMYHNYTRITSDEEVGIIDFIGDATNREIALLDRTKLAELSTH